MPDETTTPKPMSQADAVAAIERVAQEPTILRIAEVSRMRGQLQPSLRRASLKLACLSSFTFDPLKTAIDLQGLRTGIDLDLHVGAYGQVEQELINPASSLFAFEPDAVLLAVRLQDVCGDLYTRFNALDADHIESLLQGWFDRLQAALLSFRARSTAPILVQNYDLPAFPSAGIADPANHPSQGETIRAANRRLLELAQEVENLYILDYDQHVSLAGRAGWTDPRTALFARIPIATEHYWGLAGFYVKHLVPLCGLARKVLVLDADNTLWGGEIGDVGNDGIALGPDYPGNAYVRFQAAALELHRRGVLLAIASKNEPGRVEDAIANHPDMVLRPDHFAAMQVNWDPKPQNLEVMAKELNLGIDSFVFIDDSPVECEMMRSALPMVLTVQLPSDPARYAASLEALPVFDQWRISEADRKRGERYRAEAQRREVRASAVDMPTFYRSLSMQLSIFSDSETHVVRAAQMTNRTNQFNMHTIRCTEDDIRAFMRSDDTNVYTLALKDRFGDNGVIGLAVVRHRREAWTVHMMLMSCRILGRTVEQSFMTWLASRARQAGASRLVAEFVPSPKNGPFADFYSGCGFTPTGKEGDIQLATLELDQADLEVPDWIPIAFETV